MQVRNDDLKKLKSVNVDDGVNQQEARALAKSYLETIVRIEGNAGEGFELKTNWTFETHIGFAGSKGGLIIVDKKTGNTLQAENSVADPSTLYKMQKELNASFGCKSP